MGQDWKPNQALSLDLLLAMLELVEERINEAKSDEVKNAWIVSHAYFTVCYTVSLRGNEGFLLDLDGLRYYWSSKMKDKKHGDYFYICLRGQVKGEHGV